MLRYANRIVLADVESDEQSILQTLAAIMDGTLENDLMLRNFYQDVPVSFKPTIRLMDQGTVEMSVHKLQALVMEMENLTLIRTRHLPHPALARVEFIDTDTRIARLDDFGFADLSSDRRRFVRVRLAEQFSGSFKSGPHRLQGTIRDICIGGVAILSDESTQVKVGSTGIAHLELGKVLAEIPGKLLRIGEENGQIKYIVELDRDTRFEAPVSRLINHRQSEIIRSLIERTR